MGPSLANKCTFYLICMTSIDVFVVYKNIKASSNLGIFPRADFFFSTFSLMSVLYTLISNSPDTQQGYQKISLTDLKHESNECVKVCRHPLLFFLLPSKGEMKGDR